MRYYLLNVFFGRVVAAVLAQRILDRELRLPLQVEVDREPRHEHAVRHGARQRRGELLHLVERPVEIVVGRALVAAVDHRGRIAPRAEHLAFGHEAGLDQVVEHHVGAGARRRQVDVRREFRRRLEQAGEHRGFGKVHVARRLVEVVLRRGVDAEGAAAEIGAVEIELEDVVLRQPHFQPHRQEGFLHLALDGALIGEEQVLGELLRDRGAALHHAAGARIGEHRAEGARDVDAEMLEEAPVFGGEHRLDQVIGEFVERDRVVVADAARADFVAVAIEEGDRELRGLEPILFGGFAERRDREREREHQPAGADRHAFRDRLDQAPALRAGDVEAVHEHAEAFVELTAPTPRVIEAGVDARIQVEEEARQLRPPARGPQLIVERVAHLAIDGGSGSGESFWVVNLGRQT